MTKTHLSPIKIQETAIELILCAKAEGPKGMSYGHTLLGRSRRALQGIHTWLKKELKKNGYTESQIYQTWRDVCEMAELQEKADDER